MYKSIIKANITLDGILCEYIIQNMRKYCEIRLDKLNIPAETLRQTSTPSARKKLAESIELNGLLVPILIKEIGKGEYEVWDGTRRVNALRELGKESGFLVPAVTVEGNDDDSLVTQVNINQARERLTDLAEAEALRQLVSDHKWQQVDAANKLLKSKSWASKVMKVWSLPVNVLGDIRKGNIPLSHGMVISRFLEEPKILDMLHKEAVKGSITRAHLAAMGKAAKENGIGAAKKERPKKYKFGKKSWVRVEPLQKGKRFEIHLSNEDSSKKAIDQIKEIIESNK